VDRPLLLRRASIANDASRVLDGLHDIHELVIVALRRLAAAVNLDYSFQLTSLVIVQENRLVDKVPPGATVLAHVLPIDGPF
jgi:hypothetical protein